jgi:hypothetical protein
LVIGALVIAGMIAVAIVVATAGKARRVAAVHPDAAVADATRLALAPPDAAPVDAAPVISDAPHETAHPVIPVRKSTELEEHIANALAAQRAGKRMTQVTQAHAAYLIDPHNVKAILLLADGLLAEGDLEHGCKYLRELGRNPVAQQRMRSASCPSD